MRMDYKLSRILVLVIAVIFILLGVAQAKWGLALDQNVSSGLLIVAAVIFFLGRRPNAEKSNTIEEETSETVDGEKKPLSDEIIEVEAVKETEGEAVKETEGNEDDK